MGEVQDGSLKRGWGVVHCIIAYVCALGGCCASYGLLLQSMRIWIFLQFPAGPLGPLCAVGIVCGAIGFYALGLGCGLIAAVRYRIASAWPAAGLCAVWVVITVVLAIGEVKWTG